MAQDPDRPLDNGRVGLPRTDSAMNRVAPSAGKGGKGEGDDDITMRPGKPKRSAAEIAEILRRARKRYERSSKSEDALRKDGADDDKFYAGDQWPTAVLNDRSNEQRPAHVINKLPTFVHQVTNDHRQNRPSININPVGDRGDPDAAKMFRGMIRAIERDSFADIAYDTAFESTARKGWGFWRIRSRYEKEDSFDQVLTIERIRNAYTVYLDPNHKEPDGADSRFAFVTELIPREDFKEQFPNADPMNWIEGGVGDEYKEWIQQDSVRIAEYYELEYEMRTLVMLKDGIVGWKDELDEGVVERTGIETTRESKCPRVTLYKVSAHDILEEQEWPGKWIPIVKMIGDEVDIEGKVKLWGLVRFAKDPQRQYNYWCTAETELVALAPKAPWVVAEGQDEGYEQEYKVANTKSIPVLHYRPVSLEGHPVPPPQRQPFAQIPTGVANARQTSAQDMMAVTGIRFDATLGERVYDESGRALRELRERGDIGSFHFTDNFARSLRHTGEILVDLIPHFYDTKRILTILREDDKEETIQLDPNAPKAVGEMRHPQTGKTIKTFNPKEGRYGVTVTIGPSYATKRIEASESMMDFVRAMPAAGQAIMDLVAKNQDWPGAEEIAARLAKLLPPGVNQPDIKDVPPQIAALIQQLQMQLQQMQTERTAMMRALTDQQADRAQRQDKIDKDFEARLLKVVADIETKTQQTQERAQSNFNTHIGAQLKELAEATRMLHGALAPQANGFDPNG